MSEDVAIAQIVTAITTVFYAAVFAIGYYLIIRGNRQTLREMRQERLSGGRPQVIVEAKKTIKDTRPTRPGSGFGRARPPVPGPATGALARAIFGRLKNPTIPFSSQ